MSNYHEEAYNKINSTEVVTEEHQAEWTHELLGGAAAFGAMAMYNKKQEEEGTPVDHAMAKNLLAGLAGAAVDRLVETKGLDWFDRQKAKKHAEEEAEKLYTQQTGYEF
ncbi:unnamed protein product [Mucor circinelloides]|uniref:CipC-like antibiotic response protein n=2 Tax=Mucor TaxID=4830 RepID=S2IZP2_MUCC1|nr:hypothetical protein HMPREF1544_11926 [Mucor circinelloides 1006PhL]KAG1112748.1 hypothetical protein G6F42_014654 [Rhizopus arrhizus]